MYTTSSGISTSDCVGNHDCAHLSMCILQSKVMVQIVIYVINFSIEGTNYYKGNYVVQPIDVLIL